MCILVSLLSAFAKGVRSCSYLKAKLDAEAVMFDSGPRHQILLLLRAGPVSLHFYA
jgi:hypothetical protein